MSWIESHIGIDKHPKTLNLAHIMNWSVRETVGALHIFWHWCVDYAEDGDLTRYNDSTLASVVGLDPKAGSEFVEAMVKCGGEIASGFIERDPFFRVHDWWDYIGKYLQIKYKHNPKKWKGIQRSYLNRSKGGSKNQKNGRSRSMSSRSEFKRKKERAIEAENGWPSATALIRLYNEATPDSCPAVDKITDSRIAKANEYLKQFPDKEFWVEVFQEYHRSKFLSCLVPPKEGHTAWKPNLDWLLSKGKADQVENCVKVFEGKYRDG